MQIRKLVKSGAASHTIALPKDWIDKNKLNKGDLIYIIEKNNELIVTSDTKKQKISKKEITISIDDKEINTLRRQTISAYINNYSVFTFHGDSLNEKLEEIRKILDNFLALEIVEQTTTKLVAKDFLNLEEFSLTNTIRRMDMLTRSIIADAKKGKNEAQVLEFRDYEVDKLFFLMSRLIRSNLEDPASRLPNVQALSTLGIAKSLENVADAAKKLSKHFNKEIEEIYNEAEQFYLGCIKAYVKNDKNLADEQIATRIKILKKLDKITGEKRFIIKDLLNSSRNIAKITLDGE